MNESQLREAIVEVGRRLYARGYTASNDGNISARLDDRRLLMTPKRVCKGFMSPDMMVVTDLDGKKLAGERLLSRQEVDRLQGLRGMYGIASPAPICPPGQDPGAALGDPADCQTVFAPEISGARLVADFARGAAGQDGEIRLTYRELTALIVAAVRELK